MGRAYGAILRSPQPGFMRHNNSLGKQAAWAPNPMLKVIRPSDGKVNRKARWLAQWPVCGAKEIKENKFLLGNPKSKRSKRRLSTGEDDEIPIELQPAKEKDFWLGLIGNNKEKVRSALQSFSDSLTGFGNRASEEHSTP